MSVILIPVGCVWTYICLVLDHPSCAHMFSYSVKLVSDFMQFDYQTSETKSAVNTSLFAVQRKYRNTTIVTLCNL